MIASQQCLVESIGDVASVLAELQPRHAFLVIDEVAYVGSTARPTLDPIFERLATTRFSRFEPNPKLEDVERGVRAYRESPPDIVIAVGGGTAIDLAKLIGAFARQSAPARDIATGRVCIDVDPTPLMAIPTTAGTGSEATHFAVVYVDGEKFSVAHPSLLPQYAVVDPQLTMGLPPQITAATGLDAFCQAVESIWAVAATEESIAYATESLQLSFDNLEAATNTPTRKARIAMCRASHLAGKAINITKTTASHALSYALTSGYAVPHGMAVAVTLAPMFKFNAAVGEDDCLDPRGAAAVRNRLDEVSRILGANSVDDACESILALLSQVACPTTLDAVGVVAFEDLVAIVDSVNVERLSNNPRQASRSQLLGILNSALRTTTTK